MHSGVIDEESVFFLSVISEGLAVIAEQHDDCALIQTITFQPADQAPQFVIGVCDFPVVKMIAILSVVRLGWIIRAVRIIEVKPEKEWAMSGLLQPVNCVSDAFSCFAIHQAQISFLEFLGREGIVIEIKTEIGRASCREREENDKKDRA